MPWSWPAARPSPHSQHPRQPPPAGLWSSPWWPTGGHALHLVAAVVLRPVVRQATAAAAAQDRLPGAREGVEADRPTKDAELHDVPPEPLGITRAAPMETRRKPLRIDYQSDNK